MLSVVVQTSINDAKGYPTTQGKTSRMHLRVHQLLNQ